MSKFTVYDLKREMEQRGNEPHFFSRKTMRFFGDTMRNYGVRKTTIVTYAGEVISVYELYRKHPIKHGLIGSAYFDVNTFERRFPKR